jgi:TetR/AcrR family transcriptional repressor of nem operon
MHGDQTTRERLLNEMAHIVHRKGFNSTSVNDIIKAAGIKKGALYHYFKGKDELGLAVLERDRDNFLVFLDKNLAGHTSMESLDRFFKAAFQKHRDTGFVGGCLWGNTALEMSDTNPTYKTLVEKVFTEWIRRIEVVIRSGQEARQIRTDRTAYELARLIVAGIEGGIMISRLTKQAGPFRSCLESLRVLLVHKTSLAASRPQQRRIAKCNKPKQQANQATKYSKGQTNENSGNQR